MIPITLVLRDFLSYADPDPLDFTSFEIACLTGDNGVGKSALLDAMTWALFGAARGCEGGQNQDRLIREGADDATVDFAFSLNRSIYRIVRRRSRSGKSELRLLAQDGDDWTNIAAESVRETQEKIGSILRMDYKTFTASAFLLQGRSDDFLARMTPDERKEVFARLLDLGGYEELEAASRERARDAERVRSEQAKRADELAEVADQAREIEIQLEAAHVQAERANDQIDRLTAELDPIKQSIAALEGKETLLVREQSATAELETRMAQVHKAAKRKRAEIDGLDSTARELARTQAALEDAGDVHAAMDELRASMESGSASEGRIDQQLVAATTRRAELAESLALLARGGGECPVCGTPLDSDHRKTVRTSLQKQSRALDGEMKGWTSELETVRKEAARCAEDVRRLKRLVAEREKLVGARDALRARLEQRRRLEQELTELDTAAAEDDVRLTEQRAAAAAIAAEIAALPAARRRAAGVSERLGAARQTARAAEADVARLTERLGSAQKAHAALIEARQAEATAAVERRRYQRLSTAFGRGGIPDLIIDNARPELEQEANRVLGALTNGEMSVHFRLQRDTKSGKARETFEALVRPHDGDVRDFAMFSGGEAFRVAFAVRLAMSKLLVRRAGARLETLVIDEGFGTQDPEGRERLVEAINLARTEFAKILVITHLDDLKDLFGTQIRVTKDRAGSVLTLAQA